MKTTYLSKVILIGFLGGQYVWFKDPDGSGPLAFIDHVDLDRKTIKLEHIFDISFAHVTKTGEVMRNKRVIGHSDTFDNIKEL